MQNEKIYNFINEIFETAKKKNFSPEKVNEQLDIVAKTLEIEGENINSKKIKLLKKHTSKIIFGKVTLISVFEIISNETEESIQRIFSEPPIVVEACHSSRKQYSRCGLISNDPCSSSKRSISRCGSSSSSSCGSSSRNSRC